MQLEDKPTLEVDLRETRGKRDARRQRQKGIIPGVVYGSDIETKSLSLDVEELEDALETNWGVNTVFALELDDGTTYDHVIVQDYQIHPVRRTLMHVDLLVVEPDEEREFDVPLEARGTAPGEREGGKLRFLHPEVEVRCTPRNLPATLMIDVSELGPADTLMATEIEFPDDVEPTFDVDFAVARVLMPRQDVIGIDEGPGVEEEEEAELEEGEEVEVAEGEEAEGEEGEEEEEGVPSGAAAPGA